MSGAPRDAGRVPADEMRDGELRSQIREEVGYIRQARARGWKEDEAAGLAALRALLDIRRAARDGGPRGGRDGGEST